MISMFESFIALWMVPTTLLQYYYWERYRFQVSDELLSIYPSSRWVRLVTGRLSRFGAWQLSGDPLIICGQTLLCPVVFPLKSHFTAVSFPIFTYSLVISSFFASCGTNIWLITLRIDFCQNLDSVLSYSTLDLLWSLCFVQWYPCWFVDALLHEFLCLYYKKAVKQSE